VEIETGSTFAKATADKSLKLDTTTADKMVDRLNIEHSTSNIEHPTLSLGTPTSTSAADEDVGAPGGILKTLLDWTGGQTRMALR
jgi:hypothetical protein